ncbi:hypothetical protein BG005_006402 [Podila minutissima]|nr:hypothetical protein BG005_006402 [Podila minutissima]
MANHPVPDINSKTTFCISTPPSLTATSAPTSFSSKVLYVLLDPMLGAGLRSRGRIVVYGAISTYNDADAQGISALITQHARMEGFIVFDYAKLYGKAIEDMSNWIQEGKLTGRETVVHGIEKTG